MRENRILRSVLVGHFAGPGGSPAIDLSKALPLALVNATATRIVFSFGRTVIYCCTGDLRAPDAATVAILGRASGCEYVGVRVGTVVGWGTEVGWGAWAA